MTGWSVSPQREGVTALAEAEGKAKRVPAGALLMSFKLSIGKVGFAARDVFPNEAIAWLRADEELIYPAFLALALEAQDLTVGSGRAVKGNTLNGESLRAISLSLPPLTEQRRIVDLIGALDTLLSSVDAECAAVHASLISTGETEWLEPVLSSLESLAPIVTGATPKTSVEAYWDTPEVPFVTPGDLSSLGWITSSERWIARAGAESVRRVMPGSVSVVCIGATIGKVGITRRECATNQQINSIVGLPEDDAFYLAGVLAAPSGQGSLRSAAGRTAVPLLNKSTFGRVQVPWPGEAQRWSIAGRIAGLIAVRDALDAEYRALATVRQQLLAALLAQITAIPASYDVLLESA